MKIFQIIVHFFMNLFVNFSSSSLESLFKFFLISKISKFNFQSFWMNLWEEVTPCSDHWTSFSVDCLKEIVLLHLHHNRLLFFQDQLYFWFWHWFWWTDLTILFSSFFKTIFPSIFVTSSGLANYYFHLCMFRDKPFPAWINLKWFRCGKISILEI